MSDRRQIIFGATVDEQGGFHPENPASIRARLARAWKGKHVVVSVMAWKQPKTLPQLGYYFPVVLPAFAAFSGDTEDEMHRELKRFFFPKRRYISRLTGEEYEETPSLAQATAEEMSEYLDTLIRKGAEMGIPIPPPGGGDEWGAM